LALFQFDPDTRAIVLLGEIGAGDEEDAAEYIKTAIRKPVVAFVLARSIPLGQCMGHAGAVAERGRGYYASKTRALASAGVQVAENIGEIASILKRWQV
jgi:succinyl-CoA synthetase alpha subunit